jgi:hypothetical protein
MMMIESRRHYMVAGLQHVDDTAIKEARGPDPMSTI